MSTDYSWHAIAVGNRLLGLYNFLVLTLPPGWRVVVMPMASEVFSHREIGGVKWVRDGEVMHFIKDGDFFYTLKIAVRPGKKLKEGGDLIKVNKHEGYYKTWEKEGRYKVEISYYCPETDRTVKIRVEGLRDLSMLNYVKFSQCH
ncbi:MAG: hypothetical protein ACK4SY_09400 [Pyrobaculum sp.]